MNALRTLGLASLFVGSFALVACDGSGGGSLESKTPEERVDAVNSGLSKPSGEVNGPHAKLVLEASQSASGFQSISSFLDGIPGLSQTQVNAECATGSSSDGKVDLSCSSNGKASGEVSFKVSASAGGDATNALVEVTFDNVCQDDRCLDGSMVVSAETSATGTKTISQGSLDMTEGGETTHGEWGLAVTTGLSGVSVDVVVFDDAGDSYVLSTSVSAADASGKVTIKGANGEFSCSYDGGGVSGSCAGSTEFSW